MGASLKLTAPSSVHGVKYTAKPGATIVEWGSTAVYACSPWCGEKSETKPGITEAQFEKMLSSLLPESTDNLNHLLWKHGPVSVSIDAGPDDFYYYASGLYDNPACTTTELDHSVLAVGYGTEPDGNKYWIVKNSWSTYWGEAGYVRLAQKGNICGVATTPNFVV